MCRPSIDPPMTEGQVGGSLAGSSPRFKILKSLPGYRYVPSCVFSCSLSQLSIRRRALDAVAEAIGLAMERDGSSGGFVRMYVVDKDGRRFVTRAPGHGGRSDGPASLRDFAPAIRSGIMITNE